MTCASSQRPDERSLCAIRCRLSALSLFGFFLNPMSNHKESAPASEYDSELDQYFSDAEARDRVAGIVHDAVQQAVMQYGYDDELFQDWRDGKILFF